MYFLFSYLFVKQVSKSKEALKYAETSLEDMSKFRGLENERDGTAQP